MWKLIHIIFIFFFFLIQQMAQAPLCLVIINIFKVINIPVFNLFLIDLVIVGPHSLYNKKSEYMCSKKKQSSNS